MREVESRVGRHGASSPLRLLVVLCALVALAAGLAALAAGPAAAQDFSITSVSVDAQVMPNGDVRVTDTRTLDFTGTFHYVYWDLSTRGSEGIEVTGAEGPGAADPSTTVPYRPSEAGYLGSATGETDTYGVSAAAAVRVQLNFELTDTTAAFTVKYVAKGAARRWSDTAELYWQFIGAETAVESRDVSVVVHLPEGVAEDQVRAWAHGPLWGTVTIAPNASVVMKVDPLPANTFLEGRILFPAAALTQAPAGTTSRVDTVLADEKKLAADANRSRLWARLRVGLWGILGVGVPLIALVLIVVLYFRYGREPKTQFQAQYLRDFPEPQLPPALAAFIWRMGSVGSDDVTATLLDLANRKVIDLERVATEKPTFFGGSESATTYKLTLHEERIGELLPHEQQLLEFLFHQIAGGSELVLGDLKDLAKTHRTAFAKGFQTWKHEVEREAESRGFLDPQADRMAFGASAFAFVAVVAAGAAAVFSGFWWFFLGIPVGVALIFVARAVKRRSQEAAELHAQYAALERYLKDFGRLDEKPPDAIVLWEQFLIYAVVFGIADQVAKAMTVKIPEVVSDPAFRTPYILWWGMPGDGGGLSAFNEIHESFGQAVSVATSSSSSGAGGGGGFSGGGGGGGGGGGFGAG